MATTSTADSGKSAKKRTPRRTKKGTARKAKQSKPDKKTEKTKDKKEDKSQVTRTPIKRKQKDISQPPPAQTLDDLEKQIKNRYGTNIVFSRASQVAYPFHIRRPTGIPRLDLALVGGFPAGSINQVYGPEGVGKTGLCFHTGGQVQQVYGEEARILVVSLGASLDRTHARTMGLRIAFADYEIQQLVEEAEEHGATITDEDVEALQYQPGDVHVIEPGEGTVADTAPTEAMLQTALDAIRSGLFQLVIIDEAIGAGATMDRIGKELYEDAELADNARQMTNFMKKFWYAIKSRPGGRPNETTALLSSQTRIQVGGYGSGEFTQTGGQAVKHGKAMDVHLTPSKWIMVDGAHIGKVVKWFLAKAKIGTHEGARGSYHMRFDLPGMFDIGYDLIEWAEAEEMVIQRGSVYDILGAKGDFLSKSIRGGKEAVADLVRDDPDIYNYLLNELKRKLRINWRHR